MTDPVPTDRPRSKADTGLALGVVSLLFVLSGATGLAYEVIWFKRFAQLFGASSPSTAAVVACFLFGLGLGARLFGGLADRVARPLALYALCELGIAAFALGAHYALGALFPLSARVSVALGGSPALLAAARFGLAFLVIGPPTVLMGATLPLVVRHFARAGSALGSAASWLYFANSLGAAGGAWVAGFHLLPRLGLAWTNSIVAGANVLVALLAWVAAGPPPVRKAPATADGREGGELRLPLALLAASLLAGAASIALQMVWTRNLSVLVGGTTYAFSAIVCVFIAGIAAGSLAYRLVVRETTPAPMVIGTACVATIATTWVSWTLRPTLELLVGQLAALRADPGINALVCVGASAATLGAPTFFMGVLFPALVQHTRAGADAAGRAVGRVLAWNTGGSIVGATVTAPFLLPWLGSEGAAGAALAAYVLVLLLLFPPRRHAFEPLALAGAALLVWGAGLVALRPTDADRIRANMGHYLYGPGIYDSLGEAAELLYFEEAPTSNVMVLGLDGSEAEEVEVERLVNVRVNGKVDGSNAGDKRTQAGTAYLPRFLRPDAEDVLVIGFGTGTTAGVSLLFDGTSVDCCDIEGAMFEVSPFFHGVNHAPERSPRYRAIVEDGRNHLQATERSYDVILSEPSNPWIAGIANLYTTEFYEQVRRRMKPGALLGQWIQAYQLDARDFALVVNTIQGVFEHTALLWLGSEDMMLVASPFPVLPDRARAERAQALVDASPTIRGELVELFGTSDVRSLLLAQIALDRQGLERLVLGEQQGLVNTDTNLRLEFDAPLRLFAEQAPEDRVLGAILAAWDARPYYAMISELGWSDVQLGALRAMRSFFLDQGASRPTAELAQLALTFSDEPDFLADRLLHLEADTVTDLAAGVRRLGSQSLAELRRVAVGFGARGETGAATVAWEELVRRSPESAAAWAHLAVAYDVQGRIEQADQAASRAMELDPASEVTRAMVETLRRNTALRESGRPVPAGSAQRL